MDATFRVVVVPVLRVGKDHVNGTEDPTEEFRVLDEYLVEWDE